MCSGGPSILGSKPVSAIFSAIRPYKFFMNTLCSELYTFMIALRMHFQQSFCVFSENFISFAFLYKNSVRSSRTLSLSEVYSKRTDIGLECLFPNFLTLGSDGSSSFSSTTSNTCTFGFVNFRLSIAKLLAVLALEGRDAYSSGTTSVKSSGLGSLNI
jgi:hypothetical protein